MSAQNMMQDYFSSTSKLHNLLSRIGSWAVLWANYLLIEGLVGMQPATSSFYIVLVADLMLIVALFMIRTAHNIHALMDLIFFNFLYWLAFLISYEASLDCYGWLAAHRNDVAKFVFLVFFLRFFWAVKAPGPAIYYAWPITGPFSWLLGKRSSEPQEKPLWHSLLIYGLLIAAWAYAAYGMWPTKTGPLMKTVGGLVGFILFFKFFRPYMQGNLAMVEENHKHRSKEDQLAALIMAVQAQADGKLSAELVQTMCQLGQLDANAQTVLAAAIADVHRQFVAKQQGDAGNAAQLDD